MSVLPTFENELGTVSIDEDVIGIMAGLSAMECYGLVGMSSNKVKEGIADLLGHESLSRGVEIDYEDQALIIELYIVVEYGVNIAEVANNVISRVAYTLSTSTGLKVKEVNINVTGVRVGH